VLRQRDEDDKKIQRLRRHSAGRFSLQQRGEFVDVYEIFYSFSKGNKFEFFISRSISLARDSVVENYYGVEAKTEKKRRKSSAENYEMSV
jgi:hypothetical protein